jgi:hypothetical protein
VWVTSALWLRRPEPQTSIATVYSEAWMWVSGQCSKVCTYCTVDVFKWRTCSCGWRIWIYETLDRAQQKWRRNKWRRHPVQVSDNDAIAQIILLSVKWL